MKDTWWDGTPVDPADCWKYVELVGGPYAEYPTHPWQPGEPTEMAYGSAPYRWDAALCVWRHNPGVDGASRSPRWRPPTD